MSTFFRLWLKMICINGLPPSRFTSFSVFCFFHWYNNRHVTYTLSILGCDDWSIKKIQRKTEGIWTVCTVFPLAPTLYLAPPFLSPTLFYPTLFLVPTIDEPLLMPTAMKTLIYELFTFTCDVLINNWPTLILGGLRYNVGIHYNTWIVGFLISIWH